MSDSLRPPGLQHARLPCPSPTPRACSNSCPSSWWCHPTISSLSPSSPALNLSQHQSLFRWVSSSHQVAKVLDLEHQSTILILSTLPLCTIECATFFVFPVSMTGDGRRLVFDPWVGKVAWRRAWQPTPVLLLEKFRGQRSLVGYGSWDHKELDMTEATKHTCILYVVFRRI